MTRIFQKTIVEKSADTTRELICKNILVVRCARRAAEQLIDADLKVKAKGHKPYLSNDIYKGGGIAFRNANSQSIGAGARVAFTLAHQGNNNRGEKNEEL